METAEHPPYSSITDTRTQTVKVKENEIRNQVVTAGGKKNKYKAPHSLAGVVVVGEQIEYKMPSQDVEPSPYFGILDYTLQWGKFLQLNIQGRFFVVIVVTLFFVTSLFFKKSQVKIAAHATDSSPAKYSPAMSVVK